MKSIKSIIIQGIIFGIVMGIGYSIKQKNINELLFGGVQGIIYGIITGVLGAVYEAKKLKKFKKIGMDITSGKEVIAGTEGSHEKIHKIVSGYLLITGDEVIFKPKKQKVHNYITIIPLNKIESIKRIPRNTVANGLEIIEKGGIIERFAFRNNLELTNIESTVNEQLRSLVR